MESVFGLIQQDKFLLFASILQFTELALFCIH